MRSGASRNDRGAGPPADAIVAAFDQRTRHARDHIVIRSTDWRATMGEIDDWSRHALDGLERAHVRPGSIVGLSAPNGPAFLAGFLAIRRAHCTALLLDDATVREDRIRVLNAIGAHAVLYARIRADRFAFVATVETAAADRPLVDHLNWAVIKMTSGSAGTPRGVAISTDGLITDEDALARTMGIRADDHIVASLPMSHRYGFTMLTLPALLRGTRLCMPPDTGPLAPISVANAFEATVFPTVPAYLQALLRIAEPPDWPRSIRLVLTAGAALSPTTAAQFRDITGRRIHAFYGASECGGICFDRTGEAAERGTVGTPVEGVTLGLTKAGDPYGEGLVTVRSPSVAETYVPEPDERLGGGQFQTADLGQWRNGELRLLRRADRVINVRGFKVDPAEVEQILLALPGVEDVAVTGAPGADGQDTLVRAVVACRPGAVDAPAIHAWCRVRLADHKVPRSVTIVRELPRTARGKIDRAALDHA